MKIQYLAVIFIIIIMPIMIVFSAYIDNQIEIINTEATYDARLLNSTYDAIKAYQLNTINSTYYTPAARVEDIEAAVNTFFNSLVTSFKYDGNKSNVMKEYIPAIVFTMYDGYYIYSPFINTITEVPEEEIDEDYKNNTTENGLKPYVYYNCRYKDSDFDIIITYTMDNFITVEGTIKGSYVYKSGYLIEGIDEVVPNEQYKYDGITFKNSDTERLKEYLYLGEGKDKEYYYATIDGTKYYYSKPINDANINSKQDDDYIFYFDESGEIHKQVTSYLNNEAIFDTYYNKIMANDSAYQYYKQAYEFTDWIRSNLSDLTVEKIERTTNYGDYEFTDVGKLFEGNIQDSDSNFNRHRADVIRAVIQTNLSTAISGFSTYSNTGEKFIMPKISETDWELLQNHICVATFFQGMRIAGKSYNNYSVVPNNLTKEYVDENDIYILKNDNTYTRANDSTVQNGNDIASGLGYEPGVFKVNIERRKYNDKYFNPISYISGTEYQPYLESYTSMSGTLNSIIYSDMYKYMRGQSNNTLKKTYYTALGRERQGLFRVSTINLNT